MTEHADTLAGRYQDILDTTGPLQRQLIHDLAKKLNAGEYDGQCTCHLEQKDDSDGTVRNQIQR